MTKYDPRMVPASFDEHAEQRHRTASCLGHGAEELSASDHRGAELDAPAGSTEVVEVVGDRPTERLLGRAQLPLERRQLRDRLRGDTCVRAIPSETTDETASAPDRSPEHSELDGARPIRPG